MSANDILIVTIIVPNPQFDNSKKASVVSAALGYNLRLNSGYTTLSTNNPNNYQDIEGLLYVPTIDTSSNSSCADVSSSIPANVTVLTDFPVDQDYPLTAIFPWSSNPDCTLAFFAQARADAVRSAITFQPGKPAAPTEDASWSLRDGNSWENDNQFPIYALDSNTADNVLDQMVQYSGNMTDAPNGAQLAQDFDERDFPRLFAHVDLQGGTNVPSLWIFLIIVLAVLLGIVIVASVVMHVVQRHQRKVLQRRLDRGEVDLETLGIKKMNVPQEMIDKMPKYVYTDAAAPIVPTAIAAKSTTATQEHSTSFSQTTCPVCLDDFASGETEVRELPCKHIFHPECIDLFLRDNSSLCPMCKQSALPNGYCPIKVTNLMVRRERLVRRMRERRRQGQLAAAARADAAEHPSTPQTQPTTRSWMQRFRPGQSTPAQATPSTQAEQAPTQTTENATDIELGQVTAGADPPAAPVLDTRRQTIAIPADVAAQGASARRAWRRERLARQEEEAYNRQAANTRAADVGRPFWRRAASRFVPGLD